MELGMIGLGRMGANMAERLVRGGHRAVGFDPGAEARTLAASTRNKDGSTTASTSNATHGASGWRKLSSGASSNSAHSSAATR